MAWSDIAMLVFSAVTANHLGLVSEIERRVGIILPVLNCPKCLSFWLSLWYCFCCETADCGTMGSVAVSFLAAYSAIWLELGLGFIDTLYNKVYGWIYDETAVTARDGRESSTATADTDDSASEMSEVRMN